LAALIAAAVVAVPVTAQEPEWRVEENPYQEDVDYVIGDVFNPQVVVNGVRWQSFAIALPERGVLMEGEVVTTDVAVVFENRGRGSARVLVILLLEDADGNPLDRVEIRPFKVGGDRVKDRTESVELTAAVIDATRRAYLFFEVLE
jgi:hypothetical protein